MSLLNVHDLNISFHTAAGKVRALRNVSLQVAPGEAVALVGESGSGKSVFAHAIMRLLPKTARIDSGNIILNEHNLTQLPENMLRQLRGGTMGMVFQNPMAALNPLMRVGHQIMEGLQRHRGMGSAEAKMETLQLLTWVGVADAETRFDQYPHQLSGGLRQRILIAIAIACSPKLLIADEPTTALDVTTQAQVLNLLKRVQKEQGTGVLLITHDLAIVAGFADRIHVMYAGSIVEEGSVDDIFYRPQHPYTKALLSAVPRLNITHSRELPKPIRGNPPDLLHLPTHRCPFLPRCSNGMKICSTKAPEKQSVTAQHSVCCWQNHPQHPSQSRVHA